MGLTNLLMHRVVHRGWVRVIQIKPNRMRYLLTPAGIAEKARMSRAYFENSVHFYAETRNRIRDSFARLSADCVAHDGSGAEDGAQGRIVFWGTGEVAEIGYVCLQETDLRLVGVIDDQGRDRFFGMPVYPRDALNGDRVNGTPFDRLVVMSFGEIDKISAQLDGLGVAAGRVFWV